MHATQIPGLEAEVSLGHGWLAGDGGRHYRLGSELLGAGAQAEVWPAERDDGLQVVVKVARAGHGGAVVTEGGMLAALGTQGVAVARLLDRAALDGQPALVLTRYASDADAWVAHRVTRPGGLAAVLGLAAAVARALAGLHRAALPGGGRPVHRDVKPANVLIDRTGQPVLADFGGLLLVEGTGPRALGVFGSPLWAPLDQMLPGLPEPDPTWDTYACCAMLFWWVTGGSPSWQADPRPMLTEPGHRIWAALREVARSEGPARRDAAAALSEARAGTRATDLFVLRHRGALHDVDRAALAAGVSRLAPALAEPTRTAIARRLTEVLARGLSPFSDPSPPHRWWDARDLAEALDELARLATPARLLRAWCRLLATLGLRRS